MMKIKNFKELAVNDQRKKILSIAEAGLQSIDTKNTLKNLVKIKKGLLYISEKQFVLKNIEKLIFIGVGKSAVESAVVFENILGNHITNGIVIDVKKGKKLKKISSFVGSHPLPSNQNIEITKKILDILEGFTENDLVVFLISGGGSTLLCLPAQAGQPKNGDAEQEISIVQALIKNGATIQEMNTVRKHLSLARGGWLAKYAYPAKVVSLIFSDVPGDDMTFIASGPTCKDETTINDAKNVLNKYKINVEGIDLIETPKEEKYFKNVKNVLALSNQTALEAMAIKAEELGLIAKIMTNKIIGEVYDASKIILKDMRSLDKNEVLLYGGETTVKVRGVGRGGRNLQLGLLLLKNLKEDEIVLTVATDGRDNGPFGGAICDIITKQDIGKKGLSLEESLKNNDSYPLFEKAGNYLMMGDTGSNVADLIIAMKF